MSDRVIFSVSWTREGEGWMVLVEYYVIVGKCHDRV